MIKREGNLGGRGGFKGKECVRRERERGLKDYMVEKERFVGLLLFSSL